MSDEDKITDNICCTIF